MTDQRSSSGTTTLLPCPFCGGDAYSSLSGPPGGTVIRCGNCSARTVSDYRGVAADEWNTRAGGVAQGCAKCGAVLHSDDPQPGDWCMDCNMADTPAVNDMCNKGKRVRAAQTQGPITVYHESDFTVAVDSERRIIEVCGVAYTFDLFQGLGFKISLESEYFQIIDRGDGVLTVRVTRSPR